MAMTKLQSHYALQLDYFVTMQFTMDPLWDKGGVAQEHNAVHVTFYSGSTRTWLGVFQTIILMRICRDELVTNEDF